MTSDITMYANMTVAERAAYDRRRLQAATTTGTDAATDTSTQSSYLGEPPEILTFLVPAFKMARFVFDLRHIPQDMI